MDSQWYFQDHGRAQGPISTQDIVQKVQKKELSLLDLIFKEGEGQWFPIEHFSEITDLIGNVSVQAHADWIILRSLEVDGKERFEQIGPFNAEQVLELIDKGKIHFNDHVWRTGFQNWVPLGKVDKFDKPLPSSVEVDVQLYKMPRHEILEKSPSAPVKVYSPAKKAAALREEKPSEASGHDLAADPWMIEQEREREKKRDVERKIAEQKAAEKKAAEQKAAELKAAELKAAEEKAAFERRALEERMAEEKAAQARAAEIRALEQKTAEKKAAELKAAEEKIAQQKAAEQKALEQKAAEKRAAVERRMAEEKAKIDAVAKEKAEREARRDAILEPKTKTKTHTETQAASTEVKRVETKSQVNPLKIQVPIPVPIPIAEPKTSTGLDFKSVVAPLRNTEKEKPERTNLPKITVKKMDPSEREQVVIAPPKKKIVDDDLTSDSISTPSQADVDRMRQRWANVGLYLGTACVAGGMLLMVVWGLSRSPNKSIEGDLPQQVRESAPNGLPENVPPPADYVLPEDDPSPEDDQKNSQASSSSKNRGNESSSLPPPENYIPPEARVKAPPAPAAKPVAVAEPTSAPENSPALDLSSISAKQKAVIHHSERKFIFYTSQKAIKHAGELGVIYKKNEKNAKAWKSGYNSWNSGLKKLISAELKSNETRVYPDLYNRLKKALVALDNRAKEFNSQLASGRNPTKELSVKDIVADLQKISDKARALDQ